MLYVVFPPRFNIFPFRFHLRNQVISSCAAGYFSAECARSLEFDITFDNVVDACQKYFAAHIDKDMFCDVPACERRPPCKKMCQIPDHKVFYVHFMCLQTYPAAKISSNSKGTNSKGPILVYFSCFPVTSDLILCTIILSLTSMDSPPDLFPFADLFCGCLFWNCLWNFEVLNRA